MTISRRSFLSASIPAALLARRPAAALQPTTDSGVSFPNGIASGDPLAHAVVLWTRVTPDSEAVDSVEGEWTIARDRLLREVEMRGSFRTDATRDWTVKIDAVGLDADRWYWYGFRVAGQESPIGRTRTLPAGSVDMLRIAVFSCANLPFGYFNSYGSAAERDDIDLVVHLGDYIYEYGRNGYGAEQGLQLGRQVEPEHEILTLADYRMRYAQYRREPELQALHAAYPMIIVWDDHEIANNTWHSGAQNHNEGEGSFADRRHAAITSFHEWLPTRPRSGSSRDRIYQTYNLGSLASLIMLDTRLIGRDEQLDYAELVGADSSQAEAFRRDRIENPQRSMLGAEQEAWLKLEMSRSKARGIPWQILGQQLLVGGLVTPNLADIIPGGPDSPAGRRVALMAENGLPLNLDAWDGYGPARERLAQDALSFADNVIVLAGDTHNSWAFDLLDRNGRQFGVEMGTTSVTSPGLEGRYPPAEMAKRLQEANPHLRFTNTHERGYMILTVTPDEVQGEWLYVDTVENREFTERSGAIVSVKASNAVGTLPLEVLHS